MALTAFSQRLGQSQGRIEAADHVCFVLGDLFPAWRAELRVGDYAEITQTCDLTEARLVRARLHLRTPADTPSSLAWEAWLVVDGARAAGVRGWPGRHRHALELTANVSRLSGDHVVGVRLVLVASAT